MPADGFDVLLRYAIEAGVAPLGGSCSLTADSEPLVNALRRRCVGPKR